MRTRLVVGTFFGAVAAAAVTASLWPLQAWWLLCLLGTGWWSLRQARFSAALARHIRHRDAPGGDRAAAPGRRRVEERRAWPDGEPIDADDAELAAFDALQRAAGLLTLAADLNNHWIGEAELAALVGRVREDLDGFRASGDALADLAEAWRIEHAAAACARTAVALHRERHT